MKWNCEVESRKWKVEIGTGKVGGPKWNCADVGIRQVIEKIASEQLKNSNCKYPRTRRVREL
jgi:hypothetical protein